MVLSPLEDAASPKHFSDERRQPLLNAIGQLRDSSPLSTRNTSKGALIPETFSLFRAVRDGLSISDIRRAILRGEVFYKSSYETRRKIWNAISHRYLSVCPEWSAHALASATEKGTQSSDFLSLAYLYYALRDRATFEFVVGPVWERWRKGVTTIDRGDYLSFLDERTEAFPHLKRWRESSRKKLAGNTLSALRDFGLLRGKQGKHIQRPPIAHETVYHLLCVLHAEGQEGRAIVEAPDWRLFLWTGAEVSNALTALSQQKWIRFEKSGRTVMLQLIRLPVAGCQTSHLREVSNVGEVRE